PSDRAVIARPPRAGGSPRTPAGARGAPSHPPPRPPPAGARRRSRWASPAPRSARRRVEPDKDDPLRAELAVGERFHPRGVEHGTIILVDQGVARPIRTPRRQELRRPRRGGQWAVEVEGDDEVVVAEEGQERP